MTNTKLILGPMRVPFLILTPACILLGLGTAVWEFGKVNFFHFVIVLIGAVAAHISVNAFNEYFDFKSGLDFKTTPTPFSGGSGTLPAQPDQVRSALMTAWVTFGITALVGLYFSIIRGWSLLPLGLLGLVIIFTYTTWLTRNPILCLVAPGLGFGPLMVIGAHFALTGQYTWTALIASLVPFFLVSNLLLLNQFPDVEADRTVGRRHYPILIGKQTSSLIFNLFLILTYLTIGLGVSFGYLPVFSLIGLLTLVIAVPVGLAAFRNAEDVSQLIPFMGRNVIINILTPILVAVGLFVG